MRKDILSTDKMHNEKNTRRHRDGSLMTKYELTESGITIYFQMTEEELRIAKVQEKMLANKCIKFLGKRQECKREVDVYKMADGRTIRFIR